MHRAQNVHVPLWLSLVDCQYCIYTFQHFNVEQFDVLFCTEGRLIACFPWGANQADLVGL